MKKTVRVTDTTLRDGAQSPGFYINTEEKVRLMMLMDEAGVHKIDAGIPAMGTREKDVLVRMMDLRKRIKISVWNRMHHKDILHAIDVRPDVIHISVPASDRLIHNILKKGREWVVRTLKSCTAMAREKGFEVTVGFQDASRASIPFMILLANCLSDLGVTEVKLADTVGILTPASVRYLVAQMVTNTNIPLGIHTHNDLGMAVPLAIEAVKMGVQAVDTTFFGVGERAGNCDLFAFAALGASVADIMPPLGSIGWLKVRAAGILNAGSGEVTVS